MPIFPPMYRFTTLPVLSASGINNNDDIVVRAEGGPEGPAPASYFSSATGTLINVPNLQLGIAGAVLGINDSDQLVGYTHGAGPGGDIGFLYTNGTTTKIVDFAGDPIVGTVIDGINNAEQIIGYGFNPDNSFLYDNGVFSSFPNFGNFVFQPAAISNTGPEVVGSYIDSSGTEHGLVYNGGTYTAIDFPGAGTGVLTDNNGNVINLGTYLTGVNDSGQIVGDYFDSKGVEFGFLYSNGIYTVLADPLGIATAITGINDKGQIVGTYVDAAGATHGFFAETFSPIITTLAVQLDYLAMTRTGLPLDQATSIANSIDAGSTTEFAFMNSLFVQVADTTVPAVAVEASMYGAVGSSAEITLLATQFLPAQVAYAIQSGYDPLVFACQTLGLVFAFRNESFSGTFAANFGPSNTTMPNTPTGDAAFAAAATNAIFGSAQTPTLTSAILGYVHFLEGFFTANGIVGVANPTTDQIDLAARAGAWGDAVAIALENPTLAPLAGQTINFLDDAAQGSAIYSAPLSSQPTPAPFQGEATASVASTASHVQVTGVAAPIDHIVM
jgi:hypothetical protein